MGDLSASHRFVTKLQWLFQESIGPMLSYKTRGTPSSLCIEFPGWKTALRCGHRCHRRPLQWSLCCGFLGTFPQPGPSSVSGPGSNQKANHSWKTKVALSSIRAPKHLTETAARLMKESWWLSGKDSACQCRRHGFNSWVAKIPWKRKWQPFQYSCLGNHGDRGAWQATVHGFARVRHDWSTQQQQLGVLRSGVSLAAGIFGQVQGVSLWGRLPGENFPCRGCGCRLLISTEITRAWFWWSPERPVSSPQGGVRWTEPAAHGRTALTELLGQAATLLFRVKDCHTRGETLLKWEKDFYDSLAGSSMIIFIIILGIQQQFPAFLISLSLSS